MENPTRGYTSGVLTAKAGVSDLSRFIAIGDSLKHDIFGAITNGNIDTVSISNGVHAKQLYGEEGSLHAADEVALIKLIEEEGGAEPTYVLPSFTL